MDSDSENGSDDSEGEEYHMVEESVNVAQKLKKSSVNSDLLANNDGNVPLYKLLQRQREMKAVDEAEEQEQDELSHHKKRKFSTKSTACHNDGNLEIEGDGFKKKRNKNAPMEMRSDRPVRRYKGSSEHLSSSKTVDPRFADFSGELNHRIFSRNFSFLDEMRAKEMTVIAKKVKKAKTKDDKEELQQELFKMKQQSNERQVGLQVMENLQKQTREDREKVKQGIKKPFFIKGSVKRKMLEDAKFAQLKRTGKVDKYLQRKERKVLAKTRKDAPLRRDENA